MNTAQRNLFALAWVRIGFGILAWFAPKLMNRIFFVPPEEETHFLIYMNRIFGVRAFALGLTYLLADEEQRRGLARIWLLVDGADTVMGARMVAAGEISGLQAVEALAVTAGASAVDIQGIAEGLSAAR